MGAAKQRGTFEQRRQLAIERNELLKKELKSGTAAHRFANQFGIQRLATNLVASGAACIKADNLNNSTRPSTPNK